MQKHLILLHGALADESQLHFLRDALRDDAIVHLHTFACHGKRHAEADELQMDRMADEVIALAESLGSPSDVFGYSMGGYAALCAALRTKALGRIITLGTKFDWNPATASREIQFLNPEVMAEKIPQFTAHLEKIHGPDWKSLVHKTAAMMTHLGTSAPLDAKALSLIQNKVCIMVGDQDNTAGAEASRKAAMLLANSEFVVLDKTQHPIEKTNPVALTDRIRLFFYGKA